MAETGTETDQKSREQASKIYPYPQSEPRQPFPPASQTVASSHGHDDEISLYDLWCVLVRQRFWVMAVAGVSLLGAITWAWLSPDVYRAEVKMVYSLDNTRGGSIASEFGRISSIVGVSPGASLDGTHVSREVALATLESRSFTDQFLRDEKVIDVLLAADDEIATDEGVARLQSPGWRAYKQFDGSVRTVSVDRNSGVVTLGIEWYDPALAASWANALITRLNAYLQAEAVREAEKSIAYLNQQLIGTNVVELEQSIYRLIENQIKKIMVASVNEQYAFKVIDPAQVPEERHKPRRMMIVMLGLLVGIMSGLFLAFLREYIQTHRTRGGRSPAGE